MGWMGHALHVAVKMYLHCLSAHVGFRISTVPASSIQFDSVSGLCHMLRVAYIYTCSNEQHALAAPQLISCFNTNDAKSSSAMRHTEVRAYALKFGHVVVVSNKETHIHIFTLVAFAAWRRVLAVALLLFNHIFTSHKCAARQVPPDPVHPTHPAQSNRPFAFSDP